MKQTKMKKIVIPTLWLVLVVSLSWCGQDVQNQVNWWTAIHDVVNKDSNKIKANWQLTEKEKKEIEKKKMTEEQTKFKEQLANTVDKIKKEGVKPTNITDITNAYYNKQLLPKDKQDEVTQLYNKAKQVVAKQAVNILKTINLDLNSKKKIVSILQNKLKDPNATINDIEMIKNQISNVRNAKKIDINKYKDNIINEITNSKTYNPSAEIKKVSTEVKFDNIQFRNDNNIKIDNNKVLQEITKKIKEIITSLKNTKWNLSLTEFNNIVNIAKSKSSIKLEQKTIINNNFIWKVYIPYILYKWKKIDINTITRITKKIKLLNSIWVKNIGLNLVQNKKTWMYTILLPDWLNIQELTKYAQLYLAIKNVPNIVNITAKVYNIKADDTNIIIERIYNLITGSFVDYSNIKDSWEFSNMLNKLNQVFSQY